MNSTTRILASTEAHPTGGRAGGARGSQSRGYTNGRRSGFSLIEVVLALAVSALGLMVILGLLPHGLEASRNAADNTVSATLVHDIFATIRTSPFTSITNIDSTLGFNLHSLSGATQPINLQTFNNVANSSLVVSGYFDKAGFIPAMTNADFYYKVVLTFQPELPAGTPINTPAAVSIVTATVVWPANSMAPINTNVFVTKVAQYNQ
ncbi:MAG TPA: prepilin-type N-terminal cleavage/methylation domain-containing protein [Verrucomicrobiae bacterium]|nr:prepilin-type N-terminal cleavage/methylation domain-containing protein [Verrucomicrobiae bacterium]